MVRFNIPLRLSSKLKLRLLNASEIIIMQACVSLLPACVSLWVDVRSLSGEDTLNTADNDPQTRFTARVHIHDYPRKPAFEYPVNVHLIIDPEF